MSSDATGPRTSRYRSPLRAERAADTRRRIAAAALELFADHGFAGTTVTAIAARAGVSAQTIYAIFGSKSAIVRALLDQLEDAAGAAKWRDRIATEQDPAARLILFAQWSASILGTSKTIIAAAQGAASDPAIVALKADADQHRRQALTALVGGLSSSGVLAAGLSRRQAVDRAWMLTGAELYLVAIDGCGWTGTQYADWLGSLLVSQLLRAHSSGHP